MKKVLVLVSFMLLSCILYSQGKPATVSRGDSKTHKIVENPHICEKDEIEEDRLFILESFSHTSTKILRVKHIGHRQYKVNMTNSNRWIRKVINLNPHNNK